MSIGKLKEIDVRELWKHEQYDFSEWLSKQSNISYLDDILGLTLTDVDREVYVGPYRCDLVAKDETTGIRVIIENQLESTNHDHLGKIITYASGLDASVIVWIVKEAKEEHQSAIEWLNNNTVKDINFFLIEIHAYKIGDSEPAPKFEVIEKPNDFVKQGNNNNKREGLTKSESECLYFWELFNQTVVSRGKPFNPQKPSKDHWRNIAVGTSLAHVAINLINKNNYIIVELYIDNNKELFDKLFEQKENIESELGLKLEWDRLNTKKASRIKYYIDGLDFDDHGNYESLMNQSIDTIVMMRNTFKKYINA